MTIDNYQADSAIVAICENNKHTSMQESTVSIRPSTANSVNMTIGHQINKKSLNWGRSGYWSTGAGKWINRVDVTIDHQLQSQTVSW
jgi:hypothetical protein